ncbi:vWA domain-containing protein [Paenibacillus xylanexedens]|uniref:vWA domain-containing protein n=1 Tax=Paenibacillus xylanexedens TaxID=528191 RepID=UPI0011A90883|nr:vWA domain-containing protein [Paenibacillus xylanexedens]
MQRKINLLLVLFSLIGGAVGFAAGEIMLHQWLGEMPRLLLMGLYFGVVALSVGLFCLLAEMISPKLNGASWKLRYLSLSWKLLVPATLALLFVVGLVVQLLYQINPGGVKQVKDIVLMIDNSGSMTETDPNNGRFEAAKTLISQMESDKQVAVITFADEPELLQPFIALDNEAAKNEVYDKIDSIVTTSGGTNFDAALKEAMEQIKGKQDPKRGTVAILLSDGMSEVDTSGILSEYVNEQIAVNTVGLSLVDPSGTDLLRSIAGQTGGLYYDVPDAGGLNLAFQQIYDTIDERTLVTERTGMMEHSMYLAIFRVAALLLIGVALGVSLGLVFDNRHLALSFGVGGAVSGLLAGLLLEWGLDGSPVGDAFVRLGAMLLLASVLTLFTWIIPMKENTPRSNRGRRDARRGNASAEGFGGRARDTRSKGF